MEEARGTCADGGRKVLFPFEIEFGISAMI
jgi:hypothetical protein